MHERNIPINKGIVAILMNKSQKSNISCYVFSSTLS